MLRILNAGAEDGHQGPYIIFDTVDDSVFIDANGETAFYALDDITMDHPESFRSIEFLERVSLIWPR